MQFFNILKIYLRYYNFYKNCYIKTVSSTAVTSCMNCLPLHKVPKFSLSSHCSKYFLMPIYFIFYIKVRFIRSVTLRKFILVEFHPFYRPRRPLGWVEVWLHSFLEPSALDGVEESAPRPGRLYPRERHGTYFTGGWVGHSADLDGWKISSPPGFDPGPGKLFKALSTS